MSNCFTVDERRILIGLMAIVTLFFLPHTVLASFYSTYPLTGVSNCSLAWGDYDNDGGPRSRRRGERWFGRHH